jgi:chromate transport protein ChrA
MNNKMVERVDNVNLYLWASIVILVVIGIAIKDENKWPKIRQDFSSVGFVSLFLMTMLIIILGLTSKNDRLQSTARHATVALLIAYFSHLDMIFATFFLVGIFVYFTHTDVY